MSEAIRDDLIRLLHNQLPDHPADYFQLSTELNQHQLWLEYTGPPRSAERWRLDGLHRPRPR